METFLKTLLNGQKQLIKQKQKQKKTTENRLQKIPKTEKNLITKLKTKAKMYYSIIHYYIYTTKKNMKFEKNFT